MIEDKEISRRKQIALEKWIQLTQEEADFVNKNPGNVKAKTFASMLSAAVYFWDMPSRAFLESAVKDLRREMASGSAPIPVVKLVGTTFGSLDIGDVFDMDGTMYVKVGKLSATRFDPKEEKKIRIPFIQSVAWYKGMK